MNTENVYLVILLVLGIVVLSNLAMFAFVRGSREIHLDWFKNGNNFNEPFKNEDASLSELRQRVDKFSNENGEDSEPG